MLYFKTSSNDVLTIPFQRTEKEFELFTDAELMQEKGGRLVFDLEVYPNYFLASFMSVKSKKVVYFEQSPDSVLDLPKIYWILLNFCIVGFDSEFFDIPLLWYALSGKSNREIFDTAVTIINNELRGKELENKLGIRIIRTNRIDLIEVAPLQASLKTYGGRLHCRRMQDLPYNPHHILTKDEAKAVLHYNVNDLENTKELHDELLPQLSLRERLGLEYSLDLRSKSDAQIAETVIASEIEKEMNFRPKKPKFNAGTVFKYEVPAYIEYKTPVLQNMLEKVRNANFAIPESGKMAIPEELGKIKIQIGQSVYKIQIGGLHSSEKSISHKADENTILADVDVASFYPRIKLNLNLYPKHLGKGYLKIYGSIVTRRLAAKKTDKVIADALKITINGAFGKLGNKYSVLYSPHLMIGVTMTGQLSLLMLIEAIELAGIPVVSGNTDGIIIKCPKSRYNDLEAIIKEWETITRFETEETRYKAVYSRDVNNYFAVKEDGAKADAKYFEDRKGVKVKGCYAERGSALNSKLSKNPEHLICSDAVIALITDGTPIKETIYNCKDIRRFVTVRNVKGGARKDNYYLGKVVRWYYAKGIDGTINYLTNGNKVPNSDGAKPCMDLPDNFPTDINYEWYINKTEEILQEIGYYEEKKPLQIAFF